MFKVRVYMDTFPCDPYDMAHIILLKDKDWYFYNALSLS